jgi:polysaccharide chain length determinant protein (PEP-CTERM system associated)
VSQRTNEPNEAALTVDLAIEVLGRRKWIALVVFVSVAGGVASLALSLPDLYRATATVLVERQSVSEAYVRPTVTSELETRIQLIQQQVMSRARLVELISRFDLYADSRQTAPIEGLVGRMRQDIRGPELKGLEQPMTGRYATIAFALSYTARDPQTASTVANALAQLYVDENASIREGQAAQTADFLALQLAEAKRTLDEQDRKASAYKLTHIGELPQQVEANLASLERLNMQLRLNGENQLRALDRRERLETQMLEAEAASAPAADTPNRTDQIAKLRQQLQELRTRFTDVYPEVIRLRAEIAALEDRDAPAPSPGPAAAKADQVPRLAQAISRIDDELGTLKAEEADLRRLVSAYEQRVDNVPRRQEEYQALSRDYDAIKERYDTLLKRYEEAQLAERLEEGKKIEQFRILDAAIPPRVPAGPNRLRLLVMGLAAAFALAAAAVVAAEKLDTAFHDIDDLRSFAAGMLVVRLPLIPTAAASRRQRLRFALATMAALATLAAIIAGSHFLASGNEQIVRLVERGRI